jgi:hypothetical protein
MTRDTKQVHFAMKTRDDQISVLRKENLAMRKEIAGLTKNTATHAKKIANIEPRSVTRFLEEAKDDAFTIHKQYKLLILKQTVATEVVFFARKAGASTLELSKNVIKAFDRPDEWWTARTEFTMKQWIDELSSVAVAA